MKSEVRRRIIDLLVVTLILGTVAGTAAASVTISGSTTYDGLDSSSQAITVRTEVSPESAPITDVVIDISPTAQTFLDAESFSTTINPGNADINITYDGGGAFRVNRLESGESVSIRVDVYPQTIKQESLDAASVRVSYVQNGQELTNSREFSADMGNSSYFEYEQLQDQQERDGIIDLVGRIAIASLALVVVVAFIVYRGEDDGHGR